MCSSKVDSNLRSNHLRLTTLSLPPELPKLPDMRTFTPDNNDQFLALVYNSEYKMPKLNTCTLCLDVYITEDVMQIFSPY